MKTILSHCVVVSLFVLLHSCPARAELLDGIAQVYDKLANETTAKPPAVCMIDMTHPDTVREGLKKPAGQGHLAYVSKIRTRVPELSGLRCVILHYTQVTSEDLPKTNFKALLIDRLDKNINNDYLEQFYRLVRETKLPAIGFCGGGQLIAQAFGGKIAYMRKLRPDEKDLRPSYHPGQFKEWGFYPVKIVKRDPLLDGFGDQITVREYHAWEIKKLPDMFDVLASTDECPVQAIKHKTRPLYGTQFHPEHYDDEHPDGKKLLQNFFTIALGRTGTGRTLLMAQQADGEFDGWKTFHEKDGAKTGDVWRLQPDGVLVCKGQPRGYLYTEAAHKNFALRVEWRYPAGTKGGKGGVLVRMTGEHAIWPRCFECQLNQGAAGDVWAIRGYEFTGPADQLKVTPQSAFGVLRHLKRLADAEKPAGEWNALEAVVDGATITQTVNGKLVSKATGCEVVAGKILLTSEGTEIHFRNIELKTQ